MSVTVKRFQGKLTAFVRTTGGKTFSISLPGDEVKAEKIEWLKDMAEMIEMVGGADIDSKVVNGLLWLKDKILSIESDIQQIKEELGIVG